MKKKIIIFLLKPLSNKQYEEKKNFIKRQVIHNREGILEYYVYIEDR